MKRESNMLLFFSRCNKHICKTWFMIFMLSVAACSKTEMTNEPDTQGLQDKTNPTVISVTPANNTASVSTLAGMTILFSERMDSTTISKSSVILRKGTSVIDGSVSCKGTTVTFIPANELEGNTAYTVTIKNVVSDLAGNLIASEYSWSFTTAATVTDKTGPAITSVIPVANSTSVQTNTKPSVTFSELMNAATVTTSTFIVKQGSTSISGTIAISGNTATFTPANVLIENTLYTVTVTNGVKDLAGNPMASTYTWSFTTAAAAPAAKSFAADVVPVLKICNQCHTHSWSPSTDTSVFYANLVKSGHINPANPVSGKIYTKLSGGHPSSVITAEQKAAVLTWIKEGSKNN